MWDQEIHDIMSKYSESFLATGLSADLQFRALSQSFNHNVKLIPDILPEVQLRLFYEKGLGTEYKESIKYILDPCPEFQLLVVNATPLNIFNLKKQTEEVQLLALNKESNHVFQFFINPTDKVKALGIKKAPENIQYIKDPSYELMKEAISKVPFVIKLIKNPPSDLIDLAIADEKHADLIEFIPTASSEQQIHCLRNRPLVYNKIPHPTPEADWVACNLRASNFSFVKNQTVELCIMALEKDLSEVINKFKDLGRTLTLADKEVQDKLQAWKSVKIVQGANHNEVLENLKKRKFIVDGLN